MIITCNQNTSSYTTEKSHTSAFLKEFESLVFNMKTGAPGRSTYGSYATPLPPLPIYLSVNCDIDGSKMCAILKKRI